MFCKKCGFESDDDSKYCSSCGTPMKGDNVIVQDTKNDTKNNSKKVSYKLKMAGFLMIIIGIIGVIDIISFRISWIKGMEVIFESWYQFIYGILYVLGIAYGIKLTKMKDWMTSFILILIYIIHFAGNFLENNIKSPIIIPYSIFLLSLVVMILLIISKSEFDKRIQQ